MTDVAIAVEHVSKRFRIPLDHSATLKYRITHLRSSGRYRDFFALDDVSFEVHDGEFLGITGPNGCGKSTLLKILSRIYKADSGKVVIDGRVSPFLELGVGFNPELTARENIFLGGSILGLTRKQLAERVDKILDFAELDEFADQKIKNFSSGMAVRLAFSVAIQADADILLMDEVLAVGDARFQEKCFDVFAEYKRQNRTIVLVTHDLGSLDLYCDRVILLQKGKIVADGRPTAVTSEYRRMVGAMSDAESSEPDVAETTFEADASEQDAAPPQHGIDLTRRWGSRDVEIANVRLLDESGDSHHSFLTGKPMSVAIDYVVKRPVDELVCGLAFKRSDGTNISGPNSKTSQVPIPAPPVGSKGTVMYEIPVLGLLGASYLLTAAIYDRYANHPYDHIEDILRFRVSDERGRQGLLDLGGEWHAAT